jgi:hypothetical protein
MKSSLKRQKQGWEKVDPRWLKRNTLHMTATGKNQGNEEKTIFQGK